MPIRVSLEERAQTREVALAELRAQLRRGVEQADRGELLEGTTSSKRSGS
jgi:hypothetical protein